MTTDTPRTDAVQFQPRPISMTIENEMLRALSRQLERELAEYITENIRLWKIADAQMELEAEVERLKEQYESAAESVARMHEAAVGEIRGPFTSVIDDIKAVRERAEKAEAKANKLESSLRRIIDAPVFDPAKLIDFSMKLLWDSIDEAKATLNPTTEESSALQL